MSETYFSLLTVLGIGFLIFIHEGGHFLCARLAGVRVLVFSLGFGPRLFGVVRNGTDYRVSLVPLGGYVRVAGEDPMDRISRDGLHSKGVPARAFFYTGGVIMNFLFAFIAFPIVFKAGVEFTAPMVGTVAEGSPAWEAGLQPGDRIAEVGGKGMYSFENMQVEFALAGDRDVVLQVDRDGESMPVTVRPRYDAEAGLYRVGIGQPLVPEVQIQVLPDSPAARAGLRDGDLLIAIDGEPVTADTLRDFDVTSRYRSAAMTVSVARAGEVAPVEIEYVPEHVELDRREIGVTRAFRRVAGLRSGSPAIDALGLRRGDHIVAVDGRRFAGQSFAPFANGPEQLSMQVQRGDDLLDLRAPISPDDRAALDDHIGLGNDLISTCVVPRPDSPADLAGVQPADVVVAIGGRPTPTWDDLREAVQAGPEGEPLAFRVSRDGVELELVLTPATAAVDPGFLVLLQARRELYQRNALGDAISAGMVCSIDLIKSLYVTLKKLFTGEVAAKNLGGIITISRATYLFAQRGWELFVYFLALLSINLAVINLLPIPVLDGGHLLFVLIEGIKGSPVNPKLLNYSQVVGLVFIVALLVFVTYNDILRI